MYHDQVSDRGQLVLHKLATALFPQEKSELMQEIQGIPSELPSTAYADPVAKRFPCHTKAATVRSAAYFYGQQAFNEPFDSAYPQGRIVERLGRAATFFGVKDKVDAIRKQAEAASVKSGAKISLPPEAYAIDEVYQDNVVRRFPMFNSVSTVKAAEALAANRRRYPYAWRKKAAVRVLNSAMAYDAPVDAETLGVLSKMAGLFPRNQKHAGFELQLMSDRFKGPPAEAIRGAADVLVKGAELTEESRDTMCAMIDKLAADLTPDARPMVEDSVFDDKPEVDNQVPKTVRLTTGNVYALAALVQLPQDMYRILGDDVAAALLDENGALDAYKLEAVLPTLPLPDAKILEDALTGMSVSPISEEKSAESKRKGFRMLDDKDGWEEFIKTRNKDKAAKSTASFVITAPLRHDQDVHDHLTVV